MPLYLTRSEVLSGCYLEYRDENPGLDADPAKWMNQDDVKQYGLKPGESLEVRLVPAEPPSVPGEVLEAAKELSEDMKSAPEFFRSSDRWVQEMRKLIGFVESLAAGGEVGK